MPAASTGGICSFKLQELQTLGRENVQSAPEPWPTWTSHKNPPNAARELGKLFGGQAIEGTPDGELAPDSKLFAGCSDECSQKVVAGRLRVHLDQPSRQFPNLLIAPSARLVGGRIIRKHSANRFLGLLIAC
jgi:hypothetical protein